MTPWAYYNEPDPYCAWWLRNLINAGEIAPGHVDERSIEDVRPSDLREFVQCHFFAGIGVWSYAMRRAGIRDDARVWSGSCPCQPFSEAGEGKGFADERHLWPAWFHLIEIYRPSRVYGEQVASVDGLEWLDLVHTDMEGIDYAFGAIPFPAAGVGAPNQRQRIYFMGDTGSTGLSACEQTPLFGTGGVQERRTIEQPSIASTFWDAHDWLPCNDGRIRPIEPGTFPLASGVVNRVGKLRAYGNACNAEAAFRFIEATL